MTIVSPKLDAAPLGDPNSIICQKMNHIKLMKNENHQKLIILEGFSQNGLHIWIQRIFLHITAWSKIDFRHFLKIDVFLITCVVNRVFEKGSGDLLLIWSIQKLVQMCRNFWIFQIYKGLLKHFSKTRFACWKSHQKTRCESKVACIFLVFLQ